MDQKRACVLWFCCLMSLLVVRGLAYRNCSQDLAAEPCGGSNVTEGQCRALGCCWNASYPVNGTRCIKNNQSLVPSIPTTTVSTITSTSASNDTAMCVEYKDMICEPWLGIIMKEYTNSSRFIDARLGINKTDRILVELMELIDKVDPGQHCNLTVLRALMCQYVIPPCNARGQRQVFCREDCVKLFTHCGSVLKGIFVGFRYISQKLGISFSHAGIPNCTNLKYSKVYEGKNETCMHSGLYEFRPSSPPPSSSNGATIAIVCGVLAVLLVCVVVVAAFVRRRRRAKKTPRSNLAGVTFTSVSMRDRIRAESLRALDQSKVLSLFNPDDVHQYSLDRVEYVRDLGEGNFGQVFQGRAFGLLPEEKENVELMVAVKTLKEGSTSEMKESFFQEVAMMSMLHHEHIVRLLAVSTEEEPYGMIFEFMDCGDLSQYLRRAGPYFEGDEQQRVQVSQEDLLSISVQVAQGMEHLQDLRFVHRDLATRNCLVDQGLMVKIADFGMSRDIYSSDYYKVEGQAVMPIRWIPPEALLYGKFTVESDIYSYGVLLWEVFTYALQPYYGYTNEEVVDFIKKSVHLGRPDDCPDYIYKVMKLCWKRDAAQRPNFSLIIALLRQEAVVDCDTPEKLTPQTSFTGLPLLPDDPDQPAVQEDKTEQRAKRSAVKKKVSLSGYMNVGYNESSGHLAGEAQQQEDLAAAQEN